ncbi:MAG: hypothetical protein NZ742_03015, partial [Acidobacteria bacterium]|nr:hypothetical protein [Acidobacteriota bacterium]MDW7983909.1 hypothetical protein [Acidobacteriota bacterium]
PQSLPFLCARVYPENPRWGRTILECLNQEQTEELRAEFQRALQSARPEPDTVGSLNATACRGGVGR